MSTNLEVTLLIADEQGNPIPHATVWGYVLPSADPLALNSDDLWRITSRYQSSFEFATRFHPVVPMLRVTPMGDAGGKAKAVIDYEAIEGYGRQRPPAMQVGFTLMKRGYFPARIDFTVKSESRLNARVVLRHDPKQGPERQPYLQEFDRVRYELSDTSRNENLSGFAQHRIDSLRTALEGAAAEAIRAGDRSAAARIYARMQYLPVILMSNGKASGFMQADPYSASSWAYLTKAYELDPGHPYIASTYLFRRGGDEFGGRNRVSEQADAERLQQRAAFLGRLRTLMRSDGPQIWPAYHKLYATWHRQSPDPADRAKVRALLEELYRFEPKFLEREELLADPAG
ncbi:hypothetical protein [Massilia sp. LjRoot122]|uniref:hypothetical protein n=1 Tax=Massilia sp. LjRoot122 TaxID=3342257 RepID=UPI003ED116F7